MKIWSTINSKFQHIAYLLQFQVLFDPFSIYVQINEADYQSEALKSMLSTIPFFFELRRYLGILTPKWSFVLFNKSKGQRCVVIDSKIKKLVWVISRLLFRLKMKVFFMNKPYVRHKPFFQVDLFYEYQINCACACVECFVWWKITSRLIGWLWSLSLERLLFLKELQTGLIFFHF